METVTTTSARARAQWAATLDRAIAGRRVEITRSGRTVAVVYGAEHDPARRLQGCPICGGSGEITPDDGAGTRCCPGCCPE